MKKFSLLFIIGFISLNLLAPVGIIVNSDGIQVKQNEAHAEDCAVLSAGWSPSGDQKKDTDASGPKFFIENKTYAYIVVKTKNCTDKAGINLTINEGDTCVICNADDQWNNSDLDRRVITIPTDNFKIKILLGEEDCESGLTFAIGYDCSLFFHIRDSKDKELYNSWSEPAGILRYECDGACTANGRLILPLIALGSDDQPVSVDAQKEAAAFDNTYKLLAPIPGLTEVKTGGTCPNNPNIPNGVGCYLNIIFLLAIGICGVLAVIMIVISGIQYMGDESVFGKTEAKGKIMSAILGLLIALGSYAILKTIDPALTGENGVNIDQAALEVENEEPILSDENTPVPTGNENKLTNCPGGVRKVPTTGGNFIACSTFAINLQRMLSDAYHGTPSIVLSGGGFRTRAEQVALYTKNCSGKPKCNPPTARPGTSMHESGLAFDLKCDGKLINFDGQQKRFAQDQSTKKCFDWLTANASKYGLQNFKKENWHWSTNGH